MRHVRAWARFLLAGMRGHWHVHIHIIEDRRENPPAPWPREVTETHTDAGTDELPLARLFSAAADATEPRAEL